MHFVDLTGRKVGRLEVLRRADKRSGEWYWECVCQCGKIKYIRASHLKNGQTLSCRCLTSDRMRSTKTKHGACAGEKSTQEYCVWHSMKGRCLSPTHHAFKDYGARGITVCDRWRDSFEAFLSDMGPRPKGTTLERLNNSGNYEPGNCKWATRKQQQRNRRTSQMLTFQGRTMCGAAWAEELGLNVYTLRSRLWNNWPLDRALTEPVHTKGDSI